MCACAAACLLKYSDYIKKVSTEVVEESDKNTIVGEEQATSDSKKRFKSYEEEGNVVIDPCEKLAGTENIPFEIDSREQDLDETECIQILNSDDIPGRVSELSDMVSSVTKEQGGGDILESYSYKDKDCNIVSVKRNTTGIARHITPKNESSEDLRKECDSLRNNNKDLLDKVSNYEAKLSREHSLLKIVKDDHKKKLLEVYALNCSEQSESVEYHEELLQWETKKLNYTTQLASIQKEIEDITNECEKFVGAIEGCIVSENKMLKKKIQSLCDLFEANEAAYRACEDARHTLTQETSWLFKEGVYLVTNRLMRCQEFYIGISPLIADAVHLGFEEGNMAKHKESEPDCNKSNMQSNIDNAVAKIFDAYGIISDLEWPCLETLAQHHEDRLEDIQNKIREQTPEADVSKIWDDYLDIYGLDWLHLDAWAPLRDQSTEDEQTREPDPAE
ncbi:hypothetical protein Tco_0739210 [Tanacetum coccineum]